MASACRCSGVAALMLVTLMASALDGLKPRATFRSGERTIKNRATRYELRILQGTKRSTVAFDEAGKPSK